MLRTTLAALLTLPLLVAWGIRPPRRRHQLALLSLVTLGGLIAFPLLFSLGIGRTSAAHPGLILAALPLPTGLIGAVFERVLPRLCWWLGAAVGFFGEALLIGADAPSTAPAATSRATYWSPPAPSAPLPATSPGRLAPSFGTWPTTLWAITAGGALLLPVLPRQKMPRPWRRLASRPGRPWSSSPAVRRSSPSPPGIGRSRAAGSRAWARCNSCSPLVTLTLAALLLAEPITPSLLGAAALILAGVGLTQRR